MAFPRMRNLNESGKALRELLSQRILVLDGAMGTMLQQRNLSAADFGGPELEGCNENLVRTRPEVVLDIHRKYLEAGSDIIETNSFGGTTIVLAEYGLAADAHLLNKRSSELARKMADEFSTPQKPRFVAGSMGPTTKAITVTGGVTFQGLQEAYYTQAKGLVEGGVDLLLVETCQDTRNIKAAVLAIGQLSREVGANIPFIISVTIEPMGSMLAGQTIDAMWASLKYAKPLAFGMNCATGPEFMTDHIRTLSQLTNEFVSCYPNAGLPDEEGKYLETPGSLAAQLERFVDHGWLNLVGGCCGTTEQHIRAISQMAQGKKPRERPAETHRAIYTGIEAIEAEESTRPLLVGERTNVIGSRLFKSLVAEEKWEEASEIARRQVRGGAQVVDVCLQSTERDEKTDIPAFYEKLIRKVKAPVMIDTTDPAAINLALTYCQGKSIINSINLEDGEEKFQRTVPIAHEYGAAVVVGCIDEDTVQAQAFTRERKLAIAQRSYKLLTKKYGLAPEDIIFDPLVFPCATGDENYIGGAVETMEGIRLIKQALPDVRTILGISNVSFGLPPGAREVVNSVFLYYCTKAGLDLAIVNTEKIERFASIPANERELAENLLFSHPPKSAPANHSATRLLRDAPRDWRQQSKEQRAAVNQFWIAAITEHFRGAKKKEKARGADLPLDERLANYILQGTRDGLIADLERKRAEGAAPLDIINGPLMAGMAEVGRLFNANELIVAEVLQSAEAMKAAVSHLEQFMEKADSTKRGKVVLATVKGDVHDIGKNLVEIIFKNNGYEVVNLGIKVPPEELIKAYQEHHPDAIGLSGLLVKSAQQMVTTASDLKEAGIEVPLLVGGAALSAKFTETKIAPSYGRAVCYAKDAMAGLRLMNQLMDPATRETVLREHTTSGNGFKISTAVAVSPLPRAGRSPSVRADLPIPPVSYLDRKVRLVPDLREIWSYVNPYMLYGRHLGFRGNFEKRLGDRDPKAIELFEGMEEVRNEAASFMRIRAVWQFFEAASDGESLHLFAPGAKHALHTFRFSRQRQRDFLCLSDYVLPSQNGQRDHLALFVVTAGEGVRQRSEKSKNEGYYFRSHGLQALAIETAEGCAEWLHRRIREDWGFPDPPETTMAERFTSRYRGKRYSFGYPACPNLEDQAGIWKLLKPEDIGVQLTEGFMMDPEASVSALVFHHPDCTYFSVGEPSQDIP
ncbi:MAG TPA: methionine synthase [Candidatus Acidoferrum sp.]|jgi:5-methyltetrahydrofolate--homocysteine methyltransferase|nr:methionine synthase [Candidatus Acidoferrum sp.]